LVARWGSYRSGTGKPVVIVHPDGSVVRGRADIVLNTPPSIENPVGLENVEEGGH
jgi:hypothetical protein